MDEIEVDPFKAELMQEIVKKISNNDINGVRDIISQHKLPPDLYDSEGMTPVQLAAFKGCKEIVRLLLDQGADVNAGKHQYGFTALHFAALSGNTEVCQMLLEHGAKTYATISVGRTPSQLAAFVGNHACVTIINNFVPKSDIEYYTVPNGLETEPKIPPVVAEPLHKFVMHVNLHPVRIAINLMRSPILYEHIEKVKNVLELMSHKEMRKGLETNEIMSFKFHYLSSILAEIIKCKKSLGQESSAEANKKPISPVELFIKKMLKVNDAEIPEYQDNFLKEIVRKFPNSECTVFRQMVWSISRAEPPAALYVITSTINGQRGFADSDVTVCATCGEEKVDKKCSQCKMVQYCGKECQKFHWFVHKRYCYYFPDLKTKEPDDEKPKQEAVNMATEQLMSDIKNLKM